MIDLNTRLQNPLYEFKHWRLAVWNGPLFMAVFMIFWGMCFNYPPMAGHLTPDQVAEVFRAHPDLFRLGMGICMTFSISYGVWACGIAKVMEKVVGKDSILVSIQLCGGWLTVVPILVSCAFWLTAGYRPDLPATQLQQLLDNAWMLIDMAYFITSVQMFAMGAAFLYDWREKPLVPRWLNWYGIFVGFAFIAELLMPFFKSGAFARQGILNFWIEFGIWFVWCPLTSAYLLKAIPRLEQEALQNAKKSDSTPTPLKGAM